MDADPTAAGAVAGGLRDRGFAVELAGTGAALLDGPVRADLVLLGLDLPDLDGLEVCRRLRARSRVPVIALSARDSELDRVLGFQAGLDDYVGTPVPVAELVARIHAVMRRVRGAPAEEPAPPAEVVVRGDLRVNTRAREVHLGDRRIALTPKEFDLLALLAAEPGTVFTRGRIMAEVWDDSSGQSTRTIDTHVGALRAKLGARSWVVTVHGTGFKLGRA
ncbi:hypothetical protein BJP25_17240 [Actinokineospora bangkokensis]|uniref:DNA-binding response regulator n=1 Tax=Actinokineospora bangkokensis TaxID=1193682 RepID=A0A1Q9LN01_9PSEU|nr:hypothetical protein BJP25_17240 [Actinokineospora bangkokensis]